MKVKLLSRVQLLATPWTAAYQAPPSMGFSRQEYWSGLPLPSPTIVDYQSLNHDRILGNVQNTSKLSKKPGVSGWGAVGRMKRIGNSLILRVSERKNLQALMKSQTLSISVKDPEGVWARHGYVCYKYFLIVSCSVSFLCFPPLVWKYVMHLEGESFYVEAEIMSRHIGRLLTNVLILPSIGFLLRRLKLNLL